MNEPSARAVRNDPLERLGRVSFTTCCVGGIASLGLMFATAQHPPILIIILFTVWVSGPYLVFLAAHQILKTRTSRVRTALYLSTVIVTVGALALYVHDLISPPATTRAFIWTIVPPVMGAVVLLSVLVVAVASAKGKGPP